MASLPGVLGAVLAGGRSRRMGTDKARLEVGGVTLAARACRCLGACSSEVVIVSRRLGDHCDMGVPEIADRLADSGPLGGIHAALEHAGGRPVFALACDLPSVVPELVSYLLERAAAFSSRQVKAAAVVPELGERAQPLCAVYSAGCASEIERFLASGERRVLDFLSTIDTAPVELTPELAFFHRGLLENVNDRAAARRQGVELPALTDA